MHVQEKEKQLNYIDIDLDKVTYDIVELHYIACLGTLYPDVYLIKEILRYSQMEQMKR